LIRTIHRRRGGHPKGGKMYKAIIERLERIVGSRMQSVQVSLNWWEEAPKCTQELLSIRLNDKGEPDPEGRYGIAVVDRKAEVPKNPYSGINIDSAQVKAGYLYVTKDLRQGFDECKEAMLKAGFVKELKEVSNG